MCGDFSGTMTAPVPVDNPCFDDELEAVYDHILGEPDTYTPLANGPTYYPDLTICHLILMLSWLMILNMVV